MGEYRNIAVVTLGTRIGTHSQHSHPPHIHPLFPPHTANVHVASIHQFVCPSNTANNRRSDGQMSNDLCAGSPTDVQDVQRTFRMSSGIWVFLLMFTY